jgi:hypothetical protein
MDPLRNNARTAFFKCLNELNKLKAERRKQERQDQIGFERQKQAEANEKRKQELHEARLRTAKRPITSHARRKAENGELRTEKGTGFERQRATDHGPRATQ